MIRERSVAKVTSLPLSHDKVMAMNSSEQSTALPIINFRNPTYKRVHADTHIHYPRKKYPTYNIYTDMPTKQECQDSRENETRKCLNKVLL